MLPIFNLVEAASGLCRIVWVVGWNEDAPSRILSRFGEVADVTGLDDSAVLEKLRGFQLNGIVVFSDAAMMLASVVAEGLGLQFHSQRTATILSDKLLQRQALANANIPGPAFAGVNLSNFASVNVPYPAVLKPRSGIGGRDTFLVRSVEDVSNALHRCAPSEEFILEEWLPDKSNADQLFSDVVSVETVVRDGLMEHITVTGRFLFAPPFRETGSFLPSNLDQVDWDAAIGVASAAIRTIEIGHGFIHTEVKMTPRGPRIIEVNGRLGGGIHDLIQRLGGPALNIWAMKLALGQDIGPIPALAKSPVAFFRIIVAPQLAIALESVDGVSALNALPGIDDVRLNAQPGSALDSRTSSWVQNVLWITGMAASYAELDQLVNEQIASTLQLTWHYSSGDDA
jgi:biotin carboxylase